MLRIIRILRWVEQDTNEIKDAAFSCASETIAKSKVDSADKVELGKMFLSSGQDKGFQIGIAEFKVVHVGTDDAEFFSLFSTHLSIHCG